MTIKIINQTKDRAMIAIIREEVRKIGRRSIKVKVSYTRHLRKNGDVWSGWSLPTTRDNPPALVQYKLSA